MGLERAIAELNAISDGVSPSGLTELVDLKMLCNELMDSLKGAKALIDSEIAVQIAEFEGNTQTLADGRKVRLTYQKRRREVDLVDKENPVVNDDEEAWWRETMQIEIEEEERAEDEGLWATCDVSDEELQVQAVMEARSEEKGYMGEIDIMEVMD